MFDADFDTEEKGSFLERYDSLLQQIKVASLERSGSYPASHELWLLVNSFNDVPKLSWTAQRVRATLSVLYDFAQYSSKGAAWTLYELLDGNAPQSLVRTHVKDIEETLDLGVAEQRYYHFVHHPELISELKSWSPRKRKGDVDSSTWRAAIHPKYHMIDWSLAQDPVATLLALRAAHPDATIEDKQYWWRSMLTFDKRTQWDGSLRNSTLYAVLEDSYALTEDIFNRFIDKCLVDVEFLARTPDLETGLDAHEKLHELGSMRENWLRFQLRNIHLLAPTSGEDISLRKQKQSMLNKISSELTRTTDVNKSYKYLEIIFRNTQLPNDFTMNGLAETWAEVVKSKLTKAEVDTLTFVYDDALPLHVCREYFRTLTIPAPSITVSQVSLPSILVDESIYTVV